MLLSDALYIIIIMLLFGTLYIYQTLKTKKKTKKKQKKKVTMQTLIIYMYLKSYIQTLIIYMNLKKNNTPFKSTTHNSCF